MAAGAIPIHRKPIESATSPDRETRSAAAGPPRLTPLRELQLLDIYRAGGEQAQEALSELLAAYQRRIYSVCYRMVRNVDVAADLTQDSLVKLLEGLQSYDGRSKLSTWVIRVTMNCCLSHLRKAKIREHDSLETGRSQAPGGDVPTALTHKTALKGRELPPPESVQQAQTRARLLQALDLLDMDTRAILVLRDLQDLDYQQLAEVLDVPVGTVKSRLFRARASLRNTLEQLETHDRMP